MSTALCHTPASTARPDPFADLNDAQRQAVEHGTTAVPDTRPLLVIAGAGSGKTNTLAHRVARLILDGARPTAGPGAGLLAYARGLALVGDVP